LGGSLSGLLAILTKLLVGKVGNCACRIEPTYRTGRCDGVSIERVFYCDWRECDGHMRTARSRPETFLTVTEGAGRSQHFCSWDCLLKHAAEKPPTELVALDEN
jgi:hypothetical protein